MAGNLRRTSPRLLSWALSAALLVSPGAASACPVCESETGQRVREGIFGDDFAFNVVASVLPFPIFLGIVAAIHGRPARPLPTAGERDPETLTAAAEEG